MEYLNQKQRKKIVTESLKTFFKEKKIKTSNKWQNGFNIQMQLPTGNHYVGFFEFKSILTQIQFVDYLSVSAVEDIILEVQFPNFSFEDYLEKKDFPRTIFLENIRSSQYKDKLKREPEGWTEKDCIQFAEDVVNYFHEEAMPNAGFYSYLPNILKEMDKLEAEGKSWKEILSGGGHIFLKD